MSDIDAMVAGLPSGWWMWSVIGGGFGLQIPLGDGSENLYGESASEVFRKASEYKVLPKIPRKPTPFYASGWAPVKYGSRWKPRHCEGQIIECGLLSKKACQEFIDKSAIRHSEAIEAWEREFGHIVANGTEGVDYRYERG